MQKRSKTWLSSCLTFQDQELLSGIWHFPVDLVETEGCRTGQQFWSSGNDPEICPSMSPGWMEHPFANCWRKSKSFINSHWYVLIVLVRNPKFSEIRFQTSLCVWQPNFWFLFKTFNKSVQNLNSKVQISDTFWKKCLKTELFGNQTVIINCTYSANANVSSMQIH